jgi:hypothetical protein
MKQSETIEQYLERVPDASPTMNFSVSGNLKLQIPRNEKSPRLSRLNLARLKYSSIALLAQLNDTISDQ